MQLIQRFFVHVYTKAMYKNNKNIISKIYFQKYVHNRFHWNVIELLSSDV